MSDGHMEHEVFFARLAELFNAREGKDHGRVYLTQKRFSYGGNGSLSAASAKGKTADDQLLDLNPSQPLPIIVRATNGKGKKTRDNKVKLSTIVQPGDIETFFHRYSELCKTGMRGLKKRDRKARKKGGAKKKKTGADGDVKAP